MRSFPLRALVYQAAKLGGGLLRSLGLLYLLFLLFGLSLLLLGQGDRIGQPWRALPFLLLEGLGSLLPLALLAGILFWDRRWKQSGESAALRSLGLPPFWTRLGLLLGALPFVLFYGWVLDRGTPRARQALWASGPKLLRGLEDSRDLSRAAAGGLGIGLSAKTLREGKLEEVCAYLPLEEGRALGLRATRLELIPNPKGFQLKIQGGRVSLIRWPEPAGEGAGAKGQVRELAAFGETSLQFDPGLARRVGPLPPEILSSPTLQHNLPELVRLAARNALGRGAPDTSRLRGRYQKQFRRRKGKVLLLLTTLLLSLFLSASTGASTGPFPSPALLAYLPLLLFILLSRAHLFLSMLGAPPSWLPLALLLAFLLLPSPREMPRGTPIS